MSSGNDSSGVFCLGPPAVATDDALTERVIIVTVNPAVTKALRMKGPMAPVAYTGTVLVHCICNL